MSISMIGIDHSMAPVDVRARYAFTKKNAGQAMEEMKARKGISGCILLSTCNRLEVWASVEEGADISLFQALCDLKGITDYSDDKYFVKREGKEAVEHLFYLTSGLRSQIFGEDQILTQVKDALSLAREFFASDSVLEVLFRMAVTAGKKIKTEVPVSHGNPSVIHQAVAFLRERGMEMQGKTCMVIGNGEMGKVAAQTLREEGADVTVTVRQYRSGIVEIPFGCKRINYADRMDYLSKCDLVVSATASPNFTLREELFADLKLEHPMVLIDLAVPRDIEPSLGEHEDLTLYDMDSFRSEISEEQKGNLKDAGIIVEEQMEEFFQWLDGRDIIPKIQKIKEAAVKDIDLRIAKPLKGTSMETEEQKNVEGFVNRAASNVINKMIFGMRDQVSPDVFVTIVSALEKVYE
ncbi:MAG: glutamyl-tRNA reductase [Clostridiales bacterium]|nr:glutamyl-tRNA reductase [Candidatus Blautia equi]